MRRTIVALIGLAIWATGMKAQDWENIKKNPDFIWGEGYGTTINEADRNALADLTSKITTHVSSSFDIVEEESNNGKSVDSKTYVSNRIKTYSQATLNNTERIIIKNEPDAKVGRWIKRSEVARIFENREIKSKDLVESALRAESLGKVDDALRNYYWSWVLIRSLQHPNSVTYTTEDGKSHLLINWIKEKMNNIFDEVEMSCTSRIGDDVDLAITYKGRPVTSIDYTFFDGRDWSNLYSGKDGHGVLELAKGNSNDNYQIKIEFEYQGEAQIDNEIESVLSVVGSTSMRKAYKTIPASKQEKQTSTVIGNGQVFSKNTESQIAKPQTLADATTYEKNLKVILNSLSQRNYNVSTSLFTPEGYEIYTKLLKYGTARVVGTPAIRYYNITDGAVARGTKMSFSFKNGVKKSFIEDVAFYFNNEGKICNITFGLGDSAETDILYKGAWSEETRKAIMEFLENYKTAYALKRLDYIETVFDDDAVIIVANVAWKMTNTQQGDGPLSMKNHRIIKHNRYTKDQYLRRLKRCFECNEFINIRFASNDVVKLGKGGETYAIQIAQDYYSSSYGDKGYLFLMVDINNPKQPIIRLRTWQEEKDPNFGIYGPGDFK